MEHYTYVWRDSSGVPFYVGKGVKKRAWVTAQRSAAFKEIFAKGGCEVEIVAWFAHESQAHTHEIELIEQYGRRALGGILVNKTGGGEGNSGWVPSAETRAKMADNARGNKNNLGKIRTAEAKAKMSVAKIGKPLSPEHVAKIVEAKKGKTYRRLTAVSDEHRANLSAAQRMTPPRSGDYKGVSFYKPLNKWHAYISVDGKRMHLGYFHAPEDAARSYDAAAARAWGDRCYFNFPREVAA